METLWSLAAHPRYGFMVAVKAVTLKTVNGYAQDAIRNKIWLNSERKRMKECRQEEGEQKSLQSREDAIRSMDLEDYK